jgi:nicotinamidase-related amidase
MSESPEEDRLRRLLDPGTCAVLLQELQDGVVGPSSGLQALATAFEDVELMAAVKAVTSAARHAGVPVIHCTAETLDGDFGVNTNARIFAAAKKHGMKNRAGSTSVQPIPEIHEPGDLVLPRYHGLSPMTGSPLASLLRNQSIRTVVVLGVSLNLAIPNLVFDAVNRSFNVVLIRDGVVGVPIEYGEMVLDHSLSLVSTVVASTEVEAIWRQFARS